MKRSFETSTAISVAVESNMLQRGHWQLASGLHTDTKANFDGVADDKNRLELVASLMTASLVQDFEDSGDIPDAVVGVPSGAEALASYIAKLLGDNYSKRILNLQVTKFSDFTPVKFWVTDPVEQLKGVQELESDKLRIVGIEDITTTWGSVSGAVRAVGRACETFYGVETEIIALHSFAQRKSVSVGTGSASRLSLLNLQLDQVPIVQCVSCQDGVPLTKGTGVPLEPEESERLLKSWN